MQIVFSKYFPATMTFNNNQEGINSLLVPNYNIIQIGLWALNSNLRNSFCVKREKHIVNKFKFVHREGVCRTKVRNLIWKSLHIYRSYFRVLFLWLRDKWLVTGTIECSLWAPVVWFIGRLLVLKLEVQLHCHHTGCVNFRLQMHYNVAHKKFLCLNIGLTFDI